MKNILNITNGDCAVETMKRADIPGDFLPWRDVLHEGPVPEGLSLTELSAIRAGFIARQNWGTSEKVNMDFRKRDQALKRWREFSKVILWFEHDLYDQLQVLQILDWFAGQTIIPGQLTLICTENYLGPLQTQQLRALISLQQTLGEAHFAVAKTTWKAFRSNNPTAWCDLLQQDTSILPFLHEAVIRQLEEYPSRDSGLSRTQFQALRIISKGEIALVDLFNLYQESEQRRFLGDIVFLSILQQMLDSNPPLLIVVNGVKLTIPFDTQQRLKITPFGLEVLHGQKHWLDFHHIDRWLGGVHLTPDNLWLWEKNSLSLRRRKSS